MSDIAAKAADLDQLCGGALECADILPVKAILGKKNVWFRCLQNTQTWTKGSQIETIRIVTALGGP